MTIILSINHIDTFDAIGPRESEYALQAGTLLPPSLPTLGQFIEHADVYFGIVCACLFLR